MIDKLKYIKPEVDIEEFTIIDVICTSGFNGTDRNPFGVTALDFDTDFWDE